MEELEKIQRIAEQITELKERQQHLLRIVADRAPWKRGMIVLWRNARWEVTQVNADIDGEIHLWLQALKKDGTHKTFGALNGGGVLRMRAVMRGETLIPAIVG